MVVPIDTNLILFFFAYFSAYDPEYPRIVILFLSANALGSIYVTDAGIVHSERLGHLVNI